MTKLDEYIDSVGLCEFARRMGVSYQAVRKAQKEGWTPKRCVQAQKLTNDEVPVLKIYHPDIYEAAVRTFQRDGAE